MKSRRIIVLVLLVALAASIVLSVVLYSRGRSYYLQLNGVRLDPLGLSQYPAGSDAAFEASPERNRVVFFGDSRAEHWPPPSGVEGYAYANRGIGNQTTAQVLSRFDSHLGDS